MLHRILIFFHFSVEVSFINVVVLSSEVKHIGPLTVYKA